MAFGWKQSESELLTSDESNQYICNYTATPFADGAHVWQAAQNWQSIVNQTYFIYQPITMDREQARLLQIDIYGSAQSNETTGNNHEIVLVFSLLLNSIGKMNRYNQN